MTVVPAGKQYAQYAHLPNEAPGLCSFPITPNDGPLSLGGSLNFVPYNTYGGSKPAIARKLYVGVTGNLEITLANDYAASGLAFGAVASNQITIPGHNFVTGDRVMIAGAGIPTNLAAQTAYFVIVVDANTIKLATSLANAQASTPTASTLTAAGSDTFAVFKSTLLKAVPVGMVDICVAQVNAASTATYIVGLY